jgi:hypothetical protein
VASDSEEILDDSVYRPESLRVSHGFESSHLSLTLSDRLMRDFSPIVSVGFGVVHDGRHDSAPRCLIGPQLVGDQPAAFPFLTFQELAKESFGCTLITTGLHENINHVAILVDSSPQILPLTLDRHEQFVQVPHAAQASLSSPERPGVFDTKLPTPLSDGS